MQNRIAVIGGCNLDVTAVSFAAPVYRDSNPGAVQTTLGGVGRNIAENLLRLGHDVSMITPLARDSFWEKIQSHSASIGLDLSHCPCLDNASNSTYVCVNDPGGDLVVAVSSMEICDRFTPEVLEERLDYLRQFPCLVLDANIPSATLESIAKKTSARLFADAVSCSKAARLSPVLPYLTFLKVNRGEAEVLVGFSLENDLQVRKAADRLHAIGVQNVAITLGSDGAFLSTPTENVSLPSMAKRGVNYSGCGDAFFAGIVHTMLRGDTARRALRVGLATAALCAAYPAAVSPDISERALEQLLEQYKEDA